MPGQTRVRVRTLGRGRWRDAAPARRCRVASSDRSGRGRRSVRPTARRHRLRLRGRGAQGGRGWRRFDPARVRRPGWWLRRLAGRYRRHRVQARRATLRPPDYDPGWAPRALASAHCVVATSPENRLTARDERLSSREVAARLTWITAPGTQIDERTRGLLELGAGGLVLFERNVESVEQVAQLCTAARRAAAGPLRIAIDQEGGHIIRIREPLTRMPSLMAIGATRSARLAFDVARASATELASLGIDTVLGPVLDLAADPLSLVVGSRSFGSAPALVGRLGGAMIAGYHAGGLLAVGKHFPGHGRTALDSHYESPIVQTSEPKLLATDLAPDRSAMEAGVDAIMTSHCIYPALDDRPATLSRTVLERIARRKLRYDGVLLT